MFDIVERFYTDAANYVRSKKMEGGTLTGVERRVLTLAEFAADLYRITRIKTNFVNVSKKDDNNRTTIEGTTHTPRKKRQNKIKDDNSND